jgi:hypothetical protein
MFKNFKLGTKVFVGYGLILLLLIITFTYQLINLNWFQTNFDKYSKISSEEMLAGRIQANLLESRLAYEDYVQYGDEAQRVLFETRFKNMEDFIFELESGISNADREYEISQIREHANNYKQYFNKIVEYKEERDELYEKLIKLGPEIEIDITSIMDNAYYRGEIGLSHNASLALKHLLVGRLNAAKFLENNDFNLVVVANNEFSEMEELIPILKESNITVQHKNAIESISKDLTTYVDYFNAIVDVIEERNQVINELEEIGPEISNHSENIKLSIIDEQNNYTPKIKLESQMVLYRIIAIFILAIIIAIIITVRMTKFIVHPIKTVTQTFKNISEGEANLDVRINTDSKDELGEMSSSFNTFVCKLQIIMTQNKNQSWLKTGQAELNEAIQSENNINELCNRLTAYIVKYIKAHIGAIYIENEDGKYYLSGSYAYHTINNSNKVIIPGEGIIGQTIIDKQIRVVNDLPKDYISISSGLGEAIPKNIAIVPCLMNGSVKCVIEIGSVHEFAELEIEFLELIKDSIAISVNSLEASIKLKNLLDKTINQSEELQVQQEELRQSNEELEEQTRALRESEERLQAQQEELRVTNEELVERTRSLEIQKNELDKKNEHLLIVREELSEKANALEQTSKYKSEFLANMSHELRTPLNSILVLSQLLNNKKENEPLTSKQIEFAGTIHSAGTDLLRLIDDILDMSKVEAGRLVINPEEVKLHDIAENAERVFRQIAIRKGLDYNIEIDSNSPEFIITDPLRIQQIMNNLLSNAFKFTEQGGVSLTITTPSSQELINSDVENKSVLVFRIKDTGIGVPAQKQQEIFEAFKQSDGTISRKYGGTGLGLYITKELTQLLGGTIVIESQEGEGSCFSLYLPIEYSSISDNTDNAGNETEISDDIIKKNDSKQDSTKEENMITNHKSYDNSKTLLIIEDDNNFAHILSDLAFEKGYHCFIAKDGQTGIELAKQHKPGAIILDIGLPDMNGIMVTEKLREIDETKNIPIHLISGNELNVKENYKHGIIGYLQKPLSIEKIDSILEKFNDIITDSFKKVLMVDGDVTQSKMVVDVLEKSDIIVRYADTGKKVFDLLNKEEFDCIILDLKLSDMSGFDLLAKIRDGISHETPVIIYTEKDLSKEEEEQLKQHAECIIIKGSRSVDRLVDEVNLFLHELNKNPEDATKEAIETKEHANEIFTNKNILVVDDDMRNVFVLSGILEERGTKVVVGRNGRDGINKLYQNNNIDLVLMDIMMPEMDGYQAIKEIRKEKKYKNLPIIALTAKSMKEDRQKCIEAGANEYMTKPIVVDKLLSILRVWLYK